MSNPNVESFPHLTSSQWEKIDDVFSYHTPSLEEVQAISRVREHAKAFAAAIMSAAPACADTSAALRKVREALMSANAAIVLKGRNL